MKKMLFATLLVFALLLSACGNALPAPNDNNITDTANTIRNAAVPPQKQDGPLKGAVMLTDVDGMLGRGTAWTEGGMYQLVTWGPQGGANITFFDYQTHTRGFLCGQPGCSHSDEFYRWRSPVSSADWHGCGSGES